MPAPRDHRSSPRRVLVVVPAYNEEGSVGQVVAEINGCVPYADVLVVDDRSLDSTRARAMEQDAQVLTLPFNLGVGGAMRAGFRYALRNGYECVIQVDADGQHDPSEIPSLLDALQDADLVIGARFAGRGAYDVRGPRRWAMKLLSVTLSHMAKTELSDT
ncbi:MAG: glycosyltransferase family 2 protein, partial [Actinomycetota bacterium]|nr:glycosyltransferase family 2 protein [Actinomycetota bacterium]